MTTANRSAAPMLPDDNGIFDELGSGVRLAAPRAEPIERNAGSLGCYSNVAHIYETARKDERAVMNRKFARWMQLYSVRNRPHMTNALVAARGEWLEELAAADAEVE